MALAVAGLAYLAAHGARAPLLALRGLLRLRNVALIHAMPTIRDALLVPIRWVGWAGAAGVVVFAILDRPPVELAAVAAALAVLAAGVGTAAALASLQRRDVVAAVGGAGMRDPVLAIGLASVAFGPASAGVPVAYAGFCLVLAAFALARR